MDSRPRVALLNASGQMGGAERGLLEVVDALHPQTARVSVLLSSDGPLLEELSAREVPTKILSFGPRLTRLSRRSSGLQALGAIGDGLTKLFRLGMWLRDQEIEWVWSNGIKYHYLAAFLRPWLRFRLILHLRDIARPPGFSWVLSQAERVLGNSRETLIQAEAPESRSEFLPNAIDLSACTPFLGKGEPLRQELGLTEKDRLVLGLGALSAHKGQLRLIESFALALQKWQESPREGRLFLALVGGDAYLTEGHGAGTWSQTLKDAVRGRGLENRVFLPGRVDPAWAWLDAADVFALPSKSEGFGRVYLEALQFGLPVLATEAGGAREFLEPLGQACLDPEDRQLWARELLRVLEDPGKAQAPEKARRELLARHSQPAVQEQIRAWFEAIQVRDRG